MAKSTGLSASPPAAAKAAAAAPAAGKAKSKPAPPAKGEAKGKAGKADATVDTGKLSPQPPSTDSKLDSSSSSTADSINDSFSYSKEGYSSRNVTTESSTSLVDSLVNAYTGDYSGIESSDYGSSDRGKSYSRSSECNSDCGSAGYLKERFQKLDDAGQQLSVAREKVERVLDKAVEARISDSKPVPESDEKRAEKEEERITKAEGRLHRTREKLSEKQELRRQSKLDYCAKREAAENVLLSKYGSTSPELRDHIMKTFKPVIAKDSEARNDINHLQEAAEWHLKTDSEAVRLIKENSSNPDEAREAEAERDKNGCRIDDKQGSSEFTTLEEKAKKKAEKQKVREEHKKREVECRRERTAFKDRARDVSDSAKTHQLESEIEKAQTNAPCRVQKELKAQLGSRLTTAQEKVRRALDNAETIRTKHAKPDSGVDERLAAQEKTQLDSTVDKLQRTRVELDEKKELQRRHKDTEQEKCRKAEEKHRHEVEQIKRGETIEKKEQPGVRVEDKERHKAEKQVAQVERKKREVECRLDRDQFKEDVRNASDTDRTLMVERELEKLEKNTPVGVRQQLESRLNEQLSEVQLEETKSYDKEDDKRRKSVDTLVDTRAKHSGKAGQALNPISDAIDDLDSEAVRKTHKTLEDMDVNSVTSVVDLERTFGRGITEVRTDLETQIARGGKSVPKARKTLSRLDKLVRRSRLMNEGDGWDALMSCITPSGPNLGRFLGLSDGYWGGRAESRGGPIMSDNSKIDFTAARRIAKRMAQSGTRVDDERKAQLLARLGNAG